MKARVAFTNLTVIVIRPRLRQPQRQQQFRLPPRVQHQLQRQPQRRRTAHKHTRVQTLQTDKFVNGQGARSICRLILVERKHAAAMTTTTLTASQMGATTTQRATTAKTPKMSSIAIRL